jgi:hypothetical protein
MRYQLDLTLRRAEGALVRVLGTTERRGFQPVRPRFPRPRTQRSRRPGSTVS